MTYWLSHFNTPLFWTNSIFKHLKSKIGHPKAYLIGMYCCLSFVSWSQNGNLYLQFKDANQSHTFLETEIYDPQTLEYIAQSSSKDYFKWNTHQHPQIVVQNWGYKDTLLNQLNYEFLNSGDTLVIWLNPWNESLDEITVKAKNSWIKKKRVKAFERWANGWCFISRKELFITDYKLELLYAQPLIRHGRKRVSTLYRDAMNNLYLLSKDSVTQILVMKDSIHYHPIEERKKFEYLIRPLQLKVNENTLLYRDIKDDKMLYTHLFRQVGSQMTFQLSQPPLHNCGARFELRAKGLKPKVVYQIIDSTAFEKADYYYSMYMAHCLEFWRIEEVEGYFDPKLKTEMTNARNNYRWFHAHYQSTYWIKKDSIYVFIDPFSKSYTTFNLQFRVLNQYPLNFENCPQEDYILEDKVSQQLWFRKRVKGMDKLYLLKGQHLTRMVELETFTSNIRVHSGVFYYLDQDKRFKIHRPSS